MPLPTGAFLVSEVVRLREDGSELQAISRKTGLATCTISSILRQHKLTHTPVKGDAQKIVAMRKRGASVQRIASSLEVSPEYVSLVCGKPPSRQRGQAEDRTHPLRGEQDKKAIANEYRAVRLQSLGSLIQPDPSGLKPRVKQWNQLTNAEASKRIIACFRTRRWGELMRP
jgi:hypothetical protein